MIHIQKITPEHIDSLVIYFNELSEETKGYFAPHSFDVNTISAICQGSYQNYQAFVCIENKSIIAYAVVKNGMDEGELNRFAQYSIRF